LKQLELIQILCIGTQPNETADLQRKCDRTNQDSGMRRTAKGGIGNAEPAFKARNSEESAPGRLPGGDAIFQRLGQLLVDEFEREAFLEVSHHPGLHLAERHQRFQQGAVFRRLRGL
jgi:hypothetical protein